MDLQLLFALLQFSLTLLDITFFKALVVIELMQSHVLLRHTLLGLDVHVILAVETHDLSLDPLALAVLFTSPLYQHVLTTFHLFL